MRVGFLINCEQLVRWVGAWLTTTATQPHMLLLLNATVQLLNEVLWELSPRYLLIPTSAMASSGEFLYVNPLRVCCTLAAAERSSRTSTRSHCVLNCCIDILSGFHFSNCSSCNLSRPSFPSTSRPRVYPALVVPPVHKTMPRLRPRMHCRRGGTNGRAISRSSPSTSDSSS